MTLSSAEFGVWYNGSDTPIYLQKNVSSNGIQFKQIPNIPKNGEKRFDYYKKLEKAGLKRVMSANCNYLYFDNVLPVDVLFPKEIKRISITQNVKEIQKIQQFELF